MRVNLIILVISFLATTLFSQNTGLTKWKQIEYAPDSNYIVLSDANGIGYWFPRDSFVAQVGMELNILDSLLRINDQSSIIMTAEAENEVVFIDENGNKKKYVFKTNVPIVDEQQLTIEGDTLRLTGSVPVALNGINPIGGVDTIFADGQLLKFTIDGTVYSIQLEDCSIYDDQTLLLSGDTLFIENGNYVVLDQVGALSLPVQASNVQILSQTLELKLVNDELMIVNEDTISLAKYNYKYELLDSIQSVKDYINTVKTQWLVDETGDISYTGGRMGIGTIDPVGPLHVELNDGDDDIVFKHTGTADKFDIQFRENNTATTGIRYDGTLLGDKNKLEVYNYVDNIPIAQFENSGEFWLPAYSQDTIATEAVSLLGIAANGKVVNTDLSADGEWLQNGSDIYYDGGDVGIGDQTPNKKLTVEGGNIISGQIGIKTASQAIVQGDEISGLEFWSNDSQGEFEGASINAIAENGHNVLTDQMQTSLVFRTADISSPTEKMRITSSGNVGIGTTIPNAKLESYTAGKMAAHGEYLRVGDQYGNIKFRQVTSSPNITLPAISFSGNYYNGGVGTGAGALEAIIPTGNDVKTSNALLGAMTLTVYEDDNTVIDNADLFMFRNYTTPLMTIEASGDVGIGTTSPLAKLDVNGDIRSTGFIAAGKNDAGLIASKSGFFETASPVNYYTGASSWQHLIEARHTNDANNYALQIAGSFFDQNLYFRKINGNPATGWSRFIAESSAGVVKMPSYGVGSNVGTPTYSLAVNANGDIIEEPLPSGGGWHGSETRIKILPTDFVSTVNGHSGIENSTGTTRFRDHFTGYYSSANINIPMGYKAKDITIYRSGTLASGNVNIYTSDITTGTIGTSLGSASNCQTCTIDFADVTATDTNFLVVKVYNSGYSIAYINGGYITIEKL